MLGEISRCAGVQFDPVIVEALRELMNSERMMECYRDQWSLVAGWSPPT